MIENFVNYLKNNNYDFDKECVIFDIGSRDCLQSIEFFNTFPNAKIFAIECNPNTLENCKYNISILNYNSRITLIPKAVNLYTGKCNFYPINKDKTITSWSDGNPGASSLFISNGEYKVETYVQDKVEVDCTTIEDIIKEYNINKIDLIWMDLQGAELLALKSMGEHLKNVDFIHTEACHSPIYENQSLFIDIDEYLTKDYNFMKLNNIYNNTQFQDVIYKNIFYNELSFDKIELTFDEQIYLRGKPKNYLLCAIKYFLNNTDAKTIVEIGSVRNRMNHSINDFNPFCCNDGHSTYFWAEYTKNSNIYTVDINPESKNIIDNDERLKNVKSYTQDAKEFIKNFEDKIDMLFLDAWDVTPNTNYAEEHLETYLLARDKLSDKCIILIDDTDIGNGGKGRLVTPKLIEDGFTCIVNKRQTLFYRTSKIQKDDNYDVVICLGPNDFNILDESINRIEKYVKNLNKIYIITPLDIIDKNFLLNSSINNFNNIIVVNENIFPFSKKYIDDLFKTPERSGWYLQQLLKIYAPIIIKEIKNNYVIIDIDVFFHNDVKFFDKDKILFNIGDQYWIHYFIHMNKLHPYLKKLINVSGICHLMPMKRHIVESLLKLVENYHNKPFWKAFLDCVEPYNYLYSGCSEYEILFNYTIKRYINEMKIVQLEWKNDSVKITENYNGIYESCPWHTRNF